MKTRIISGIIMLPLLAVVFFGGRVLLIASFIIGILGVREFYRGFESIGVKPSYLTANISILGLYAINLFGGGNEQYYRLWFFAVIIMSLLYLFKIEERELQDAMVTMAGIFYVIFFSFHVTLVEQIPEYGVFVWLIFITAFGTDSMAYFSGFAFGKHKLCPKISPKKTIEGAIGGTLGSLLFCALFGYFVIPRLLLHCIIIGLLGGIISQFGDLTASIFKRKIGIKDYGNLIPGHGGVLDRIDSVLFTAPLIYYYIMLVIQ
ncbi:phosphatidate cytidylyltransferase [Sinanaerobacter chloroacetimidivorans]|uniref:Phosphatidate cytidylyltransferase n=1 Tax=Sinanaerobacter chloroacetimidivorans TaxID=2818044 RepID=A0A8J8B204_9FIRM|nr:phosphatidate cytidylyltransferase [Sinanaerobacter chloroacetimidivorans]MBR0596770.1 phosphatidate cytidylyltransferase [Sinanaerobacter chloroacetimidivorans]